MMNAMWMPMESANLPCSTGRIAPPTIAIIIRLEPLPVSGPSCAVPSVKMVGNMTELNRPTAMMLPIAMLPVVATEVQTRAEAITAALPSTLPGEMARITAEPAKRPTMAPPQ